MLNWERIAELKTDFGEEDFREVVSLFLTEVESSFDTLLSGSFDNLNDELHSLKGSAANLGFEKLTSACVVAEQASPDADLPALREIYMRSKDQFLAEI